MRVLFFLVSAVLLLVSDRHAVAGAPLAAWVQLGENTRVRAIVADGTCPEIMHDGGFERMSVRTAPSTAFPLLCESVMPSDATYILINGVPLPLPVQSPNRILVIGDTGCRLQGSDFQACNDPSAWVFPRLAAAAAKLKPQIVIHAGDYVSREQSCPAQNAGCQGSPYGDNWAAWQADFFGPAAPLLALAPIVLARGNHEDCNREGIGWLYLMGADVTDGTASCRAHTEPYRVRLGDLSLAVVDTANALDVEIVEEMTRAYAADLSQIAQWPEPVWMVQHRPDWGAVSGPLDIPIGGNQTLIAATRQVPIPGNVKLMLSGHIHGFEAINYYSGIPPQIISGNGGDRLHDIPRILKGAIFQGWSGVQVRDGFSENGFGFLMLTKSETGWDVDTYDPDGHVKSHCRFDGQRIDCPR